ncbi:MAG TPA: DNA repair protein RadC [Candidatus Saccharimonadia bacterium]|nr:DNA repair protein RadC [Candidatus Saccharimonadia bacterium]
MTTLSKISRLPASERPRERLLMSGAQAISTQDLLSIILGTGSKGRPVEQVAKRVEELLREHSVREVSKEMLLGVPGLGSAKVCSLLAMFELAERFQAERDQSFTSPEVVVSFLHELRESSREMLIGLYLNARYSLVHKEVLSIGSMNQAIVTPREIFSPIKQFPIAYLILAHNHPSGDPKPSEDDKEFTIRMQEAGELMGVDLIDHIIIAKKSRYSFKEEKFL